ncbi:MAG: CoA-binding protein [Candidatus Methylarchaceae archaeon HK02M1]|nr:CoA-binding protein [Candidatus Methylarchaceae archaeon HK01M]MCP8312097.1 CoA-binding protein [Candidatus Methylarchaceae archaeon HK02M1]
MENRMKSFFEPASVAAIGASHKKTKVGNVVFHNLLMNKERGIFKGEIYPVNPKYTEVLGIKCYPSLKEIQKDVEMIVIAVPAEAVPNVMEDAGEAGVKAAIIISSGFNEVGNKKLEDDVVRIGLRSGIRIIGPNCMGIYNPYSGIDTLFLPEVKMLSSGREVVATARPFPGSIVLISQSGAFGAAALDYMAGHGMGVRAFVSLGNRCDVEEHELLSYFAKDKRTKVILLYIEGINKGREFFESAKGITKVKPIVALKAGRTWAGAKAAASHTAALSGVDQIYGAVFKQCGIVRAMDVEELFDMGRAINLQLPSPSNKTAILTNGGGPGVVATDACEESGLSIVKLSESITNKFDELKARGELIPIMVNSNPVDLTALATSDMYARALKILLDDKDIDGLLVITLPQTPSILDDVIEKVADVAKGQNKPVVACVMGGTEMAEEFRVRFEKSGIPSYSMPGRAAKALYSLMEYGKYLRKAYKRDK